jgi:hypothetical protein
MSTGDVEADGLRAHAPRYDRGINDAGEAS